MKIAELNKMISEAQQDVYRAARSESPKDPQDLLEELPAYLEQCQEKDGKSEPMTFFYPTKHGRSLLGLLLELLEENKFSYHTMEKQEVIYIFLDESLQLDPRKLEETRKLFEPSPQSANKENEQRNSNQEYRPRSSNQEDQNTGFNQSRNSSQEGPNTGFNQQSNSNQEQQNNGPAAAEPAPQSPYDVFGLQDNASQQEVRRAYLQAVRANHPDKANPNDPSAQQNATEKTQEITSAYQSICESRGWNNSSNASAAANAPSAANVTPGPGMGA